MKKIDILIENGFVLDFEERFKKALVVTERWFNRQCKMFRTMIKEELENG